MHVSLYVNKFRKSTTHTNGNTQCIVFFTFFNLGGNSLIVQWLRLYALTTEGMFKSLFGELNSCKPHSMAKNIYIYIYVYTHIHTYIYIHICTMYTHILGDYYISVPRELPHSFNSCIVL